MKHCYITTAIDYVNSVPHIGHAYEKVCADALARFMRLRGIETFLLIGNDEHSANVEKRARSMGKEPLAYCDEMEERFASVWRKLSISHDAFIRTTADFHMKAVAEVFNRITRNGDIYKGTYRGWYCVSCEAYKKESDLVEKKCATHQIEAQWIEEENYFFRLTKYRDRILAHIEANADFIRPKIRRNEIVNILKEGLDDVSVSRASTSWGVAVPDDPSHVVWVWFDALINYISGVGFPNDQSRFDNHWPADYHIIGKDITRLHCIMWPAMLLAAGLPLPKSVLAHGFIYVKGQKMSKTLGTAVDPSATADKYGSDALRYFLLREVAFDKDGDFTWEKFIERYNADLANDLGNLLHRTTNMLSRYQGCVVQPSEDHRPADDALKAALLAIPDAIVPLVEKCEFHDALGEIWNGVRRLNMYVEENAPWTLSKQKEVRRLATVLANLAEGIRIVAILLKPFIPDATAKIWRRIGMDGVLPFVDVRLEQARTWDAIPPGTVVTVDQPLFPKIEIHDDA